MQGNISEEDARRIAQFNLFTHKLFIAEEMRRYIDEIKEGCHSTQQYRDLGILKKGMIDIYNRLIGNVTIAEPENIFIKPQLPPDEDIGLFGDENGVPF